MCNPAIALMVVSAAAQARASQVNAKLQSAAAEQNSRLSRVAAADAIRRGELAEHIQRTKTSLLSGRQQALIGSSGAVLNEGTTSLILEDTAALGELDALQARNNAAREAWGLEAQAAQFDFAGQSAIKSGRAATFASLLGAASDIASFKSGTTGLLAVRGTGPKKVGSLSTPGFSPP